MKYFSIIIFLFKLDNPSLNLDVSEYSCHLEYFYFILFTYVYRKIILNNIIYPDIKFSYFLNNVMNNKIVRCYENFCFFN